MKKFKFILTEEEIHHDIKKANEMVKSGQLIDPEVPSYWSKGVSPFDYKVNVILAIFLGIFALDRFYLKKYISGVTKLFFILLATPVFIWLFTTNILEKHPAEIIIFGLFSFCMALGYYVADIVIGIISPRDYQYKKLVKNAKS